MSIVYTTLAVYDLLSKRELFMCVDEDKTSNNVGRDKLVVDEDVIKNVDKVVEETLSC